MTIAACYLSTEGVVLGADSTTTMLVDGPDGHTANENHFNYAQKIFEFGKDSTVGIVTWGLGSLGDLSYRTLAADVANGISQQNLSLQEVAGEWSECFWKEYCRVYKKYIDAAKLLAPKKDCSADEIEQINWLQQNLSVGFCLGGNCISKSSPSAYVVTIDPFHSEAAKPIEIKRSITQFWGCPSLINRVIYGIDASLFEAISKSKEWSGDDNDLFSLVSSYAMLSQPTDLPLREAIDWIYSSIYTTIKGMKFSHLAPVCGGPIEIAVITSDRPFRWVRHKRLDEAIT